MKTLLMSLLCIVCLLTSCTDDAPISNKPEGTLNFIVEKTNSAESGRLLSSDSLKSVLISIRDEKGVLVYDRLQIDLISFGGGYKIEPLALKAGNYQLIEFVALNKDGVATYAVPKEGSTLAHLVADPLPINFKIAANAITEVNVEVVKVEEDNKDLFGYTVLSFNIVKTFSFNIAVFTYNKLSQTFELSNANLIVKNGGSTIINQYLQNVTNKIYLKDQSGNYTLNVAKQGYAAHQRQFPLDELKQYANSPMVITLYPTSLTEGLEVYYPFSGNANDESGNQHHGTVYGATLVQDRNNNINSSYYFNGNSRIDLGNILDNLQYPFTFSSWVKLEDSNNIYNPVFTSQDNAPLYNGFDVNTNVSGVGIGYGDGYGENNPAYRRGKTVNSSIYGVWTHICGVVSGPNNIKLYINGKEVPGYYQGETQLPMASNFPNDIARIGQMTSNGVTYNFKGFIDEVKVWSRALSADEVPASM
ncbi:hypothetical protein KK060_05350 [Fulvivirgaceae bacterium PWU20]|uniref:LamG-like jellyroll fold domain-containing protein n=2 Tax=Chryseosolibacter indicus TaxID=2782351 RepID=A0ABS5VPC2_9BACT|nr:hypothetical protein [Chryseosolibacter indicus]